MPGQHAQYSPSKADRWMTCPASLAHENEYDTSGSSEFADEGTAAHTLFADCLLKDVEAASEIGRVIVVEQKDDEGHVVSRREFTVDAEMAGFVQVAVDKVLEMMEPGWTLLVEQRVEFTKAIGTPRPQFGTSDVILVSPDGDQCIIADLKYGRGVKVFATRNRQMLTYAVGVRETFDLLLGPFQHYAMWVLQPRIDGGHFDKWECTNTELNDHRDQMWAKSIEAQVAIDQHMAKAPISPEFYGPNEKACFFCPHKLKCVARDAKVAAEIYGDFANLDNPLEDAIARTPVSAMTRLGSACAVLDFIEQWCKDVRAECERQVVNGMTVIGTDGLPMKLIQGRKGNRFWKDQEKAQGLLAARFTPDKYLTKPELVTVAAAEKLFGAKRKAEWAALTDGLVGQADGNPKVVLGSHPAPAYVPAASAGEFTNEEDPLE